MATVSLQTVFDEARRALETGAADKAIGIAQHILVHFPRMIEGHRLLGEAHLNASQPEQAAAAFERVLQSDPENVAAYYGLGLARQNLDQRGAAITAFERALEIQPNLADLRSQLMRLYAETPGSAGQFRLSRAGLGRLYARGGMFGQSIDEFRAVLDSDSSRDDVKAALAEALWRDGQEDEAMEFCRDALDRQPDLLKPTVLLGYLLFATGQPEGETLWRRAGEQDATMTLARSLFDILPPIRMEEPVLSEFDEAEWRAKEARRTAEQPAQAAAPTFAATSEDDFFADSWLSSAGSASTPASTTRIYDDLNVLAAGASASAGAADDDDDLLASLLGFGGSEPEPASPTATSNHDPLPPFGFDWENEIGSDSQPLNERLPSSLDDVGLHDTEMPRRANEEVSGVQPFSFDDWSLDEDLPSAKIPSPSAIEADLDFPDISAFSLDDDTSDKGGNVQPFSFEAEKPSGVQPFSLDEDLDSFGDVQPFAFEDEGRDLSTGSAPAPAESGLGNVQPFSLDDWGLDDAAGSSNLKPLSTNDLTSTNDQLDDFGTFKPFSLDELSLDTLEDETGGLSGPQIGREEQEIEEPSGFSWQEPSWRAQATQSTPPESVEGDSIFAKLMRNRPAEPTVPESPASAQIGTQSDTSQDLDFFSIDDEPLRLDEGEDRERQFSESGVTLSEQSPASFEHVDLFQGLSSDEAVPTSELPQQPADQPIQEQTDAGSFFSLEDLESGQGFSWETSATNQQPDQTAPAETGGIFSLEDLESEQGFSWETGTTNQQPDQTAPAETGAIFSLEDLESGQGFSWETGTTNQQPDQTAPAETGAIFSLEDLESEQGFSWETGATNQSAETVGEQPTQPFSLSDLGLSDDELSALDIQPEALATPTSGQSSDALPFSLSDLGFSDDELSALTLQEDTAETPEPAANESSLMPALPEDIRSDLTTTTQSGESPQEEADMTPFSLADLGLNDDELAFFEQVQTEQAIPQPEAAQPVPEEEADMTPFSLADLDLNDDELAFFEQAQTGQDLDTASHQTSEDVDLLFADFDIPSTEEPQPTTPTAFTQGNESLELPTETTITAEETIFNNPLATDIDDRSGSARSGDEEADMTPFSLADLGLSDDELTFFEQAQAEQASPQSETAQPVAEEEADMTPFSLADLGLSDDELTFFEQAQTEQASPQPETQESVESTTQPESAFDKPFSLADLETGSPFENIDQADLPAATTSTGSATDEFEGVFSGDTQAANQPLPMDLPEGAQSIASAAEEFHSAPAASNTAAFSAGGGDLSSFHSMLEADPENDAMRLALARMSQQTNDLGQALEQYKQLIKRGNLLDEVVVDLEDSIADSDDPQMLRRLHRLLGDAYMKQNRFREAMDEYSWTLARSR